MTVDREVLCFCAVGEEAAPLRRAGPGRPGLRVVVTGMGRSNARVGASRALAQRSPALVLTCGFAGGLNPALSCGTVVYAADACFPLESALRAAGAVPGRFHCASHVAVTAAAKRELREQTGADAVEMESEEIRALCREHRVPSATVRVISDAAAADLPLDFNRVTTPDGRLSYPRLMGVLARQPGKILALVRFRRILRTAADHLAAVVLAALE